MPGPSYETVARLTTDHHGQVSTAMAREQGVSADARREGYLTPETTEELGAGCGCDPFSVRLRLVRFSCK